MQLPHDVTMSQILQRFQYPQADRRGCNNPQSITELFEKHVSVSTSGSKGVQLYSSLLITRFRYGFSIHKRIEGGATVPELCKLFGAKAFQYPQADRRGCNNDTTINNTIAITSFSIHKRIEGGATLEKQRIEPSAQRFQYPQADRRGCNFTTMPLSVMPRTFQYPQADRRGCNGHPIDVILKGHIVSVSTSGSKGVQPLTRVDVRRMYQLFQYPQADRRGCNYYTR